MSSGIVHYAVKDTDNNNIVHIIPYDRVIYVITILQELKAMAMQ